MSRNSSHHRQVFLKRTKRLQEIMPCQIDHKLHPVMVSGQPGVPIHDDPDVDGGHNFKCYELSNERCICPDYSKCKMHRIVQGVIREIT